MIVIVAIKLNVEHKAVGEPNPHPGNMGGVERVAGEHGEGHCFSTLLLDLHSPAQALAPLPSLRISKPNTLWASTLGLISVGWVMPLHMP
jgi:hypothetical protein